MVTENPRSCSKLMTVMHDGVVVNMTKEKGRIDTESCFNSKPLHKYAKYIDWPAKLPAKRYFLNIKSDSDAVQLCITAHFERNYHLERLKKAETKKQREAIQRSL